MALANHWNKPQPSIARMEVVFKGEKEVLLVLLASCSPTIRRKRIVTILPCSSAANSGDCDSQAHDQCTIRERNNDLLRMGRVGVTVY